jgi:hypothetical protein
LEPNTGPGTSKLSIEWMDGWVMGEWMRNGWVMKE